MSTSLFLCATISVTTRVGTDDMGPREMFSVSDDSYSRPGSFCDSSWSINGGLLELQFDALVELGGMNRPYDESIASRLTGVEKLSCWVVDGEIIDSIISKTGIRTYRGWGIFSGVISIRFLIWVIELMKKYFC